MWLLSVLRLHLKQERQTIWLLGPILLHVHHQLELTELPPSGTGSSAASALLPRVIFMAPVGPWVWLWFERSFVDEGLWTIFHSPTSIQPPIPSGYCIYTFLCPEVPLTPKMVFIISFIAFSCQPHCNPLGPLEGESLLSLSLQLPHLTAAKSYFSLAGRARSSPHALCSDCMFTFLSGCSLSGEMLAPASQQLAWFLASPLICFVGRDKRRPKQTSLLFCHFSFEKVALIFCQSLFQMESMLLFPQGFPSCLRISLLSNSACCFFTRLHPGLLSSA